MQQNESNSAVEQIMLDFADLTGLGTSSKTPKRYLWTDAFAVCNFIGLFRRTGDRIWLDLALQLVEQVHQILGQHRADDPRSGWISGLSDEEGRRHPTRGGLRIGKEKHERSPFEPFDERLEWDRDGQYFHYLTKWMHALRCVGSVTGENVYTEWALELAKAVHARFSYRPAWGGPKRLFWKMSTDLSRPLVPFMGQHDPLDGLVTYNELQEAAGGAGRLVVPDLQDEINEMAEIYRGMELATDDALGIGGLLCDAVRIAALITRGVFPDTKQLEDVLEAALTGLKTVTADRSMDEPAMYRLAFRELGLSIGLKSVTSLSERFIDTTAFFDQKSVSAKQAAALADYLPLAEKIDNFWLDSKNQTTGSWSEHREINMVMLATSLAPDGFLTPS